MAHEVELETAALRTLGRLPLSTRRRLSAHLDGLAENPRPAGCEKLAGMRNAWRVRAGDYRIVYTIDDANQIVTVTRIGHRRDVYRRM